ncbi:MAG: hypothetical protein ABSB84_02190 [Verrucomicrobiota bacterium]|jgi:hypothetical protein
MLKIEPHLESWLPTQPEYRMGYQKVIATLNTGGTERGIIVNSQVFLKEGEYPYQMFGDWNYVHNEALKSSLRVTRVQLIPREPETLRGVRQIVLANEKNRVLANRKSLEASYARASGDSRYYQLCSESQNFANIAASAAAEDAPITLTELAEIFRRFSAYANDHRVTPGKGLTPGTFATTKEDADANIKTGSDAVARYALPNSKPASNVFTISPAKDTEVKRGTAQPANNQPGGGVEVIFVNGLPDGTVTGPVTIPDR